MSGVSGVEVDGGRAARGRAVGEDHLLGPGELLVGDVAPRTQLGQPGELVHVRLSAARGLPDVGVERLLLLLRLGDLPLAHGLAARDDVDEDAEEGQHDAEHQPARLGPAAHVSSRKMSTTTRKSRTNHMIHRKNHSIVQKALSSG